MTIPADPHPTERTTLRETAGYSGDGPGSDRALRFRVIGGRTWIFGAALGFLAAVYLLQTASPLRLDSDSVVYLYTGGRFADGRAAPGVNVPLGYPVLLAALNRAGLGSPFVLILANCIFLGLGLFCFWHLCVNDQRSERRWLVVLTLLAVPVIHTVALPLPEPAYFGVSLLSLLLMCTAETVRRSTGAWFLVVAFVLTVLAVSLRNAGLALIPALLWSCFSLVYRRRAGKHRRLPLPEVAAITLGLVALLTAISQTTAFSHSIHQARVYFSHGIEAGQLPYLLVSAFIGLGELVVNLPHSKFHGLWIVFLIVGMISAAALWVGIRARRPLGPVGVYALFYLGILLFWPYPTPRLWMPIVPLLMAYATTAAYPLTRTRRSIFLLRGYLCWFILTGGVALACTSRISLAGGDSPTVKASFRDRQTSAEGVRQTESARGNTFEAMTMEVIHRYGDRILGPQQ